MQDWLTALSTYSATREHILEHRFLGDVCSELWCRQVFDFAVFHSEVDNSGYDVIIEASGVMRHIQLKAMHTSAKRRSFDIQARLADRPDGCVVLIVHDAQTLATLGYRWFGGPPGEGLCGMGDRIARHNKGNALGIKSERPALREVSLSKFEALDDASELVSRLFGAEVFASGLE